MQGSFTSESVVEYYNHFEGSNQPNLNGEALFNFSSTALSVPEARKTLTATETRAEKHIKKARNVLEMAGRIYRENPDSKNYDNLCQAERLMEYSEKTFAKDFKDMREQLMYSESFDSLDYTRCVRPDGSTYGSRGKCKKGRETSAKAEEEVKESPKRRKPSKSNEDIAIEQLSKMLPKGEKIMTSGGKEVEAKGSVTQEEKKVGRPKKAQKAAMEMSPGERREFLLKRASGMVKDLRKLPPQELMDTWRLESNNGNWAKKYPSTLQMAKDIASDRIRKDLDLVRKREVQSLEPVSVRQKKMANEMIDKATKNKDAKLLEAGIQLMDNYPKNRKKDIDNAQERGRKIQEASSKLYAVERELRNKTNKMDMGYAPEDKKVRERLSRVEKAVERVNSMIESNWRVRGEVEKDARRVLKTNKDKLDELASTIRNLKGAPTKDQIKEVDTLVREVQRYRKILNEGPSLAPDLGGKLGSPIDTRRLYEKANV